MQPVVRRPRIQHLVRILAQLGRHIRVLCARRAYRQQRQDLVRDAALTYTRPGEGLDVVLRLLEVRRGPGPELDAFDLKVRVELLEDEEEVAYAYGAAVQAAIGRDFGRGVVRDEAGEG